MKDITNQDNCVKLDDKERTECEIWTRVMGYHRPISSFNIGKQGEYMERKYFTESKCRDTLNKPA